MAVNLNDERFQTVEREKQTALNNINNTYNQMIDQSDSYYNNLQNQVQDYAKTQSEIQQANTDFAIDKINQQKDWAEQDYKKEQKAAYTDYQKQINPYGAEAEKIAQMGLANSGYSESSRVAMYNTYQNRYATARESFNRTIVNYDNGINEAIKSNNAKLAEISAQAQAKALELSLQGFQYKNSLLQSQLNAQQTTEDRYYSRWKDTLNQINTENALAEQKRQFNASLNSKIATIQKTGSAGSNGNDSINKKMALSDPTEYSQSYDPMTQYGLSLKATSWYLKNFNKHSYKYKDLKYVLDNALKNKTITDEDAVKIYNSYGIYGN